MAKYLKITNSAGLVYVVPERLREYYEKMNIVHAKHIDLKVTIEEASESDVKKYESGKWDTSKPLDDKGKKADAPE